MIGNRSASNFCSIVGNGSQRSPFLLFEEWALRVEGSDDWVLTCGRPAWKWKMHEDRMTEQHGSPSLQSEHHGRSGIVFGASSGVGAALVERLASTRNLQAVSRRGTVPSSVEGVASVIPVTCDVKDYAAVERIIAATPENLDFLVSCVGVGFYAPFDADFSEYWKDILETNVVGTMNILSTIKRLRPACRQVVVLGSVAAKRPSNTPGNMAYRVSKAALSIFLEDFRAELRNGGSWMKLCHLAPGFIEGTDFDRRFYESAPAAKAELYGSFASLKPHHIAKVVHWVLETDSTVDIGELVVRPTAQPS